jgi:hypothetical protein
MIVSVDTDTFGRVKTVSGIKRDSREGGMRPTISNHSTAANSAIPLVLQIAHQHGVAGLNRYVAHVKFGPQE